MSDTWEIGKTIVFDREAGTGKKELMKFAGPLVLPVGARLEMPGAPGFDAVVEEVRVKVSASGERTADVHLLVRRTAAT